MGTHIQIRDVPDEVHAALVERATGRGQSLAEYLREELSLLASQPELAEVAQRIRRRRGGAPPDRVIAAIRAGRAQ